MSRKRSVNPATPPGSSLASLFHTLRQKEKKTILLSSLPLTLCHQAAIIFLLNMFSQNHQDLSNSHSEHCEMRSQRKPFALQLTFQIYDLQQII